MEVYREVVATVWGFYLLLWWEKAAVASRNFKKVSGCEREHSKWGTRWAKEGRVADISTYLRGWGGPSLTFETWESTKLKRNPQQV